MYESKNLEHRSTLREEVSPKCGGVLLYQAHQQNTALIIQQTTDFVPPRRKVQ